ncbi:MULTISPECIES: hypothetical protein [unclassified Sphingomonas]|uniref:hypothetical protein n=1 Tax=unclassified Sphingomonas TaxID=196159 RepID=UPI0006FB4FBA|nr:MULTISPECIES: hypothetical protein [unclassified Sphingomonas]KQS50975.1 hypothetical protein ASG20_02480 [Sphingomonas sp. Leaf198]TCP64038.1 hypothetical protein C8J43_1244 [Sphingomonas sp. PP-CE-1G-424]
MTANIPDRVARLETSVEAIGEDVKGLNGAMGAFGGKLDKLVDGLTQTDGRVAERAQAVKAEIRDEGDRKARDRSELFKNGLALFGGISLVVGCLCGPYLAKLDATSIGQREDTQAVSAVREVLAQHGSEIGRNRDSIETSRERSRRQDDQLLDLNTRVARIEGTRTSGR